MSVSQTVVADSEACYHRILDGTGFQVYRYENGPSLKSLIYSSAKAVLVMAREMLVDVSVGGKLVGGACTSFLVTKEAVELRSVVNDIAKE